LIGGSVGLAARERAGATVRGYDLDPAARAQALELGVVDVAAGSLEEALDDARVAVVAVPVAPLPAVVAEVLSAAGPDCAVTDVGSTKRGVVAACSDERFVGGHPLAGAETAGVAHARGDLFEGATWYLTPGPASGGLFFERLHRLIGALGAQPVAIDAERHDRMMASVSHLPHVLANVLVAQAAGAVEGAEEGLPATGPSFRDATRVAGASNAIWTDIYLSNRDALIERIDDAMARLGSARELLASGDRAAIDAWNDAAAADRHRLLDAGLVGGATHELRVSVPNRPGVVAQIALELGRAGINITDMALYPAADNSSGVIALWLQGDDAVRRVEAIAEGLGFPVARA
jgi:prephenate dehydrogenase